MDKQNLILIILASALLIGYSYGLDLPQALEYPLRQQPFNFTNIQFNLLYFFTFVPVIVFQIPIGVLIDKYPIKRTMYALLLLSFFSQLIAGLSFQFMWPGYKWIVMVTRSTFGVCGEALFTVQAIFLTYFAKDNYETTMAICLSLPFSFDSINSVTTTHVYDATKYMALIWYISTFICFVSIISGLFLDRKYITRIQDMEKMELQNEQGLMNQDLLMNSDSQNVKKDKIQKNIKQDENQEFNFKSLTKLSSQFWVICASIFFFQACLGPFFDNLNDLLVKRFNIQYTDSGKMLLIPFSFLVVFSYMSARICRNRPHWRRKILLVSSILYFISMCILYLLPNTDSPTAIYYIAICFFLLMMSIMFASQYSILITSVSYFVDKEVLGTAYGVAATSLGTCQCLVPLINSAILDQYSNYKDSYKELTLFGTGLAIFPIIFALWVNRRQFKALDFNLKDDFEIVKKRKNSHR